ncbi:unnamed protein product [Prunus brigantina]
MAATQKSVFSPWLFSPLCYLPLQEHQNINPTYNFSPFQSHLPKSTKNNWWKHIKRKKKTGEI